MLKNKFQTLCQNFTADQKLIATLWQTIEKQHLQKGRHYHTLQHLEAIYKLLPSLDTVTEFAIFYHDIVYEVLHHDNEEQSAVVASKSLALLGVQEEITKAVSQLIIETKTHEPSSLENTFFLDADIGILGASEKAYAQYIKQIRKEYEVFDDATYQSGRKKVLEHFLAKERIYGSDYFYERFELKARRNLESELASLS